MKSIPQTPAAFILFALIQILIPASTFAAKKSYVVYLGEHGHASDTNIDHEQVRRSHYDFLAPYVGSRENAKSAIFYSYTRSINGFAAVLDESEAKELAKHQDVLSVFINRARKLQTTRSWSFVGLENNGVIPPTSAWKKARFGEDTIIANLDTGVWPEARSFSDAGMGPVPARFKGVCDRGSDPTFRCNRKLIGARFFNKGWLLATGGPKNASTNSPRDVEGHGTHTLSTAGGGFVSGASVFGFGNGTAKGGSPKARVVGYRVCFPAIRDIECLDSDVMAAFDFAISDGIDVLSVSLGSGGGDALPFFEDGVAIGSFHAVRRGITVVCSAGNSGPEESTISNVAPWQITVGASTIDREFPSYVMLGNKKIYKGQSLSKDALPKGLYPIISGANARMPRAVVKDALLCKPGTLDRAKAQGKILVCQRGSNTRVDKGRQAQLVGAVGMVLANNMTTGNEVIADAHLLPAAHVNYSNGQAIFTYANSTRSPVAYITYPKTALGTKPAPFVAAFSSKGPNIVAPEILKPDVIAHGVSVIAAYTEAVGPSGQAFDKRRVEFNSQSGTSMSCPVVAGIVGLLKTAHPRWSPAAIRSALMTTATVIDNANEPIINASNQRSDPFALGAGHVNPNKAIDPGLVYDMSISDYLNFLCSQDYDFFLISIFARGFNCPARPMRSVDVNYPAIAVPKFGGSIIVRRVVTNVGAPGVYVPVLNTPRGIVAVVKPRKLVFSKIGEKQIFTVTLKAVGKRMRKYVFGDLTWMSAAYKVRIPIAIDW